MSSSTARGEAEVLRPGGAGWLPLVMLLVLGTLWGGTFTLSKVAIDGGVPPLGYAFWQAFGPALILLLVCALRRIRLGLSRGEFLFYVTAGLLGITIPNINFFFVIAHIPAGVMAVVVATAPMLTYGFALTLGEERFGWGRAGGIGLGLAGALCLLLPRASLPDPAMLGWVVLAFLTPAFYAANSLYSARRRPAGGHSLALACGMMFGASLFQSAAMLASGSFYPLWPPFALPDWALIGQIAISAVAYIMFFEVLRLAGAVFFSQVGYIVTLTGLAWGMVVFGERHSGWLYLATGLIFAGLALVNLQRRARRGQESAPRGPSGG
jgi:drug/metabolite transporter (DMT)-like permease